MSEEDKQLVDAVVLLDGCIPREGGKLRVSASPDEVHIAGDRTALLRLGRGLLRGITSPPVTAFGVADVVDTQAHDLLNQDDRCVLVFKQLLDSEVTRGPSRIRREAGDLACLLVAAAVAIPIIGVFAVGLYTVATWVWAASV